jgi:surface polysaccharide O-acyltransferase-like enzyme
METTAQRKQRNIALDLLRVIAIFLVLWQHSSEYYYIGDHLTLTNYPDTFTIGFFNSLSRSCIGLFVMISGYFLLPMKDTTPVFFRKRFTRILFPWLFWCIAFAVYYVFYRGDSISQCLLNIAHIPVNWGVEVGHLWYIYMLIGLYLLIPILSPWIKSSSKKEMQVYLGIWGVTLFLPYIHMIYPNVLGECTWNQSPMLYYFNGFVGYLILGSYFRKYGVWSTFTAAMMLLIGYAATVYIFNTRISTVEDVVDLEIPWDFCVINVAMMVIGIFSLVSKLEFKKQNWMTRLIVDVSLCSFAMYLSHIMLLNLYHDLLDGISSSVLVKIPLIACCTFITVYLIVKLLSYLPKSKYWLGTD